jgi:archaellum component FlaC
MLNDEDIIKLKSVFATKDDFKEIKSDIFEFKTETNNNFLRFDGEIGSIKADVQEVKSDMADLKELVQALIVSTDNIAKAISDLRVEYSAISTQLSRHELWIKQIAEKVGLKLVTD